MGHPRRSDPGPAATGTRFDHQRLAAQRTESRQSIVLSYAAGDQPRRKACGNHDTPGSEIAVILPQNRTSPRWPRHQATLAAVCARILTATDKVLRWGRNARAR